MRSHSHCRGLQFLTALGILTALALKGPSQDTPPEPLSSSAVARLRHAHPVFKVAFTPDGKTLFAGTYDRREPEGGQRDKSRPSIWGWDVRTHENTVAIAAHEGRVFSLALAPDGSTLVSAGDDGTSRFWDLTKPAKTPQLLRELPGQFCAVYADGKTLATVTRTPFTSGSLRPAREIRRWPGNGMPGGVTRTAR